MSPLPARRPLPVIGSIGSHAYRAGRSLQDSPLLDRLLRGRIWIGILAVLLFGLVALNVSLLELNSAAGRNAEKAKALRVKNDRLRASVSRLRSGGRLERVAGQLGLVMPEAGTLHYLSSGGNDAKRAARALRAGKRSPASADLEGTVTLGGPQETVAPAPAPAAPAPAVPPATAPTGTTGPAYAPPQQQPQVQQQPAPAATQGAQPGASGGQGATTPAATAPTG